MRHVGTIPFETERLFCRPFQVEDLRDMLRNRIHSPCVQSESVALSWDSASQVAALLEEYTKSYEKPDAYRWAIVEKERRQIIGQIALGRVNAAQRSAEIEFAMGFSFLERGYADEVLTALINHSFLRMDFQKLEAYHKKENLEWGRVFQASIMQITDTVGRFVGEHQVPRDVICYCIDKDTHTLERVRSMERCFDTLQAALRMDPNAMQQDAALQQMLHCLTTYYENGQWLADYQADEQGMLPADLKRGVLSQDAVYDLLSNIRSRCAGLL